eukprot:TRINITY_DN50794_c0_g1_i1.p1 TRINITY_DN50794_c0_g1~~TRINITY_DN50794_c0_g1_i1.p1  ORF type:complete len:611 (+),score=111.86 TRINITY_DN50794_c0_g1_i1:51-1883(+)
MPGTSGCYAPARRKPGLQETVDAGVHPAVAKMRMQEQTRVDPSEQLRRLGIYPSDLANLACAGGGKQRYARLLDQSHSGPELPKDFGKKKQKKHKKDKKERTKKVKRKGKRKARQRSSSSTTSSSKARRQRMSSAAVHQDITSFVSDSSNEAVGESLAKCTCVSGAAGTSEDVKLADQTRSSTAGNSSSNDTAIARSAGGSSESVAHYHERLEAGDCSRSEGEANSCLAEGGARLEMKDRMAAAGRHTATKEGVAGQAACHMPKEGVPRNAASHDMKDVSTISEACEKVLAGGPDRQDDLKESETDNASMQPTPDVSAAQWQVGVPVIRSQLYVEDSCEAGHSTVWGSFFSCDLNRWGYACCQITERYDDCPQKKAQSSSWKGKRLPTKNTLPLPVLWTTPPPQLKPWSNFTVPERFVSHFIRYVLGQWQAHLTCPSSVHGDVATDAVFRSEEMLRQTEDVLEPLVQMYEDDDLIAEARDREQQDVERMTDDTNAGSNVLKLGGTAPAGHAPDMTMAERLANMAHCAYERDYAAANQHYVKLTLGNKKWHQAYHGGEGKMNSGFKLHTVSASALSTFDRDSTVNNYIRGFRRLLLLCQLLRPNSDVSKRM